MGSICACYMAGRAEPFAGATPARCDARARPCVSGARRRAGPSAVGWAGAHGRPAAAAGGWGQGRTLESSRRRRRAKGRTCGGHRAPAQTRAGAHRGPYASAQHGLRLLPTATNAIWQWRSRTARARAYCTDASACCYMIVRAMTGWCVSVSYPMAARWGVVVRTVTAAVLVAPHATSTTRHSAMHATARGWCTCRCRCTWFGQHAPVAGGNT